MTERQGDTISVLLGFFVLGSAGFLLYGCGNGERLETPEQRKALAGDAGELAALSYLAIDKPDADKAKAVKVVVDKIRSNLTAYEEGGFIKSLPGVEEAVKLALPNEDDNAKRLAANKLAKTLLEELDVLFEKHPEWKGKSDEVTGIIGAFCDGASKGFEAYVKKEE